MKQDKDVYRAGNPQLLISGLLSVVALAVTVQFFMEGIYVMGIVLLIIGLLSLFVLLTSPVYMLFSQKELVIVYFFGCKETIRWKDVRQVHKYGGWLFSRGDGFPHYTVVYPKPKKRLFFMLGDVPKTRKVSRLFAEFYGDEPVDKGRRKKK